MQIAEYYDSAALIWDDDSSEAKAARIVTAMVSIQRGGACVMDVGCGSGAMFADLMDGGACEIEGVDISGEMIRLAEKKYGIDPRIHLTRADFLQLEQPGYEVIVSFHAYHHFLQPRDFLKKARELLLPRGRLTAAFPFGRERMNTLSGFLPGGLARQLLPAAEEAELWREYFTIDSICDNDSLYLLSGTAK